MTIEGVHNYLSAKLPWQLNASQYLRLMTAMFVLLLASTLLVHLLVQAGESLAATLIHATMIAVTYTLCVAVATAILYQLRDATKEFRVWHIWSVSLAGFILGYYVLPLDALIAGLIGIDTDNHAIPMSFQQLLPVWFLVTFLFVQPYINDALRTELDRLREINSLLKNRAMRREQPEQASIRFESGRTGFALTAASIRNIVVEDHYCYVFYLWDGNYVKRDLAKPLNDIQALLPAGFARVHRSHIVNLQHVNSLRRSNRNLRLILDGGYEVPVSRHRLDEVLPLLSE